MAEAEYPPVLEGFICPICKIVLGEPAQLVSHFQEHSEEQQALSKTFKDLLDKAKKKILKPGSSPEHGPSSRGITGLGFEYTQEPQEIGIIVNHTERFNSIRSEKIQRLSVPTNQLIIRLDKLLDNMPSDPIRKKVHEQNTVPWVDGTAVNRCPTCAGLFHLARRQHHCRTCGSIMCNDCSHFMSIHTARKILDKPVCEDESGQNIGDLQLRLCHYCISLLETREQMRESKGAKPIISQFYDRFAEYKNQANENYKVYTKMCDSLNAGESNYNLEEAQMLRVKLLRLAENINSISSRLAVLGTKDTECPPQGHTLRLQNAVRAAATAYLRTKLLNLPTLPTEQQFEEAQARRRQEITNRIQEEKNRQAKLLQNNVPVQSQKPAGATHQKTSSYNDPPVSLGQGWVPEKKKVNKSDDPLIEQMNIIRSYINEAKAANKFEEVASLEANLQDLKNEFWKMQDMRSVEPKENLRDSQEDSRPDVENHNGDY